MALPSDYKTLQRDRAVLLGTPITDETANDVIAKLLFLQMDDSVKPITLVINSPGGSATATLAIYDTMQFLKTPLITYNIGLAYSAACLLLAAGHRGNRWMKPDATVGFSRITGGASGGGDVDTVAAYMMKLSQRWNEILLKHTNLTSGELEHFSANSTVLTGQHALQAEIVDRIAEA